MPGTAETTEQVFAGSSSNDCKKTASEVDPRSCLQRTTGTSNTNTYTNMDSTRKNRKTTGSGEFGGPRHSAEGVTRAPLASLSDYRGEAQVGDRAYYSLKATESREKARSEDTVKLLISEGSSGEDSPLPWRTTANKRRKRTIASTSPSGSEASMRSDNETEDKQKSNRPRRQLQTRASKGLPTDEERLAEIRHAPSANLAVNILEVADSN